MKSCLLTLDEIETGLEKEFAKLEPEISGYRLRKPGLSMSQLQDVETALETNLPDSFKRMVRAYDFGDLTVGGVFFGQTGIYAKFLLEQNGGHREHPWWGAAARPERYLMIAGSDGYVILLHSDDGKISAYLRAGRWSENAVISADFEVFLRACGTVYLKRPQTRDRAEFVESIVRSAGGATESKFWTELIVGRPRA